MSFLWKKIEFYKGKNDCKAIVIAGWNLGGVSGRKMFWLFNIFKVIKQLTITLKNYILGLIS